MRKLFWPVVLLMLLAMATAQVWTAWSESATWDEPTHLAAGYSYLRTGDLRLNPEHPPLVKMLCALPLLFLSPHLPLEDPSWAKPDQVEFGRAFVFRNRLSADTLLFAGRCVNVLLSLCFALVLALWTRAQFGVAVALLATLLYTFDPNFIAHGHYVTTDVAAALAFFLACIAWIAWLRKPEKRRLVVAGFCLGLALAAKFSMVVLLPLLPLLYLAHCHHVKAWVPGLRRAAVSFAGSVLIAGAVIAAVYGPETLRPRERLFDVVDRSTPTGYVLGVAGKWLRLPAHPFLVGLDSVARHNKAGQTSYLLGRVSDKGWWYYFPVVLAVKTTTAVLLLLALVAALALVRRRRPAAGSVPLALLALPPLVYLAAAMTASINLGVRHILPVYPFLYVLLAAGLFRLLPGRKAIPIFAVIAAMQVVESVHAAPHYLAFFNWPSGGSERGPEYLLDSNIDWGQDLKGLKRYMVEHKLPRVCLCYFGGAVTGYYGVDEAPLPHTDDAAGRKAADCVAAISATPLYDVYVPPGTFRWLREKKPIGTIGYSIYLYDLRQHR